MQCTSFFIFFFYEKMVPKSISTHHFKNAIGFRFYQNNACFIIEKLLALKKNPLYIVLNLMKYIVIHLYHVFFFKILSFMNQSKGRLLTSCLCYDILHKSSFKHSLIHRLCFNPFKHYSHMYYSAIKTFFFSSVNISHNYDINISKPYLMQHFCTISKPHIFSKIHFTKQTIYMYFRQCL